jgi:hypothetical protein
MDATEFFDEEDGEDGDQCANTAIAGKEAESTVQLLCRAAPNSGRCKLTPTIRPFESMNAGRPRRRKSVKIACPNIEVKCRHAKWGMG